VDVLTGLTLAEPAGVNAYIPLLAVSASGQGTTSPHALLVAGIPGRRRRARRQGDCPAGRQRLDGRVGHADRVGGGAGACVATNLALIAPMVALTAVFAAVVITLLAVRRRRGGRRLRPS
jgi:hypothetical protein